MGFTEMAVIVLSCQVQARAADHAPLAHGIVPFRTQGHGNKFLLIIGHVDGGAPAHQLGRLGNPRLQARQQFRDPLPIGRAMKAPHAHTDGMHGTAAEQGDELIAQGLQAKTAPHRLALFPGQIHHAVAAEEIRRRQQVNVQGMALDPLATVHDPAHGAHPGVGSPTEAVFQGLHGAHLVGHGTDAADARHHVRHLAPGASLEEFLEEARRLEDAQLQLFDTAVLDTQVQGTLALHPRQHRYLDVNAAFLAHPSSLHFLPSAAKAGASLEMNRKRRAISTGSRPRPWKRRARAPVLGFSAGPKQP